MDVAAELVRLGDECGRVEPENNVARSKEFDPSLHPRDPNGQFTETTGAGILSSELASAQARLHRGGWSDRSDQSVQDYRTIIDIWESDGLTNAAPKTATDKQLIRVYTTTNQINTYLRSGNKKGLHDPDKVDAQIKGLDRLIAKSTLNRDVTVYRGISPDILNGVKPGDQLHSKQYMSTTLDPRMTSLFGKGTLIISAPKGSPAAQIEPAIQHWANPELELVFPRGSSTKITRIEWGRDGGYDTVLAHAELVST